MSSLQRGVLLGAAGAIGLLVWLSFSEGYIEGVDWLWPLLAIAALLYFAARDRSLSKKVAPTPKEARPPVRSPKMQQALDDFAKVTVALASTIQMKNDILRVITPKPVDGDADIQALQADLIFGAEVEAFILAYSVHWCQPKRRPSALPSEPEFLFYRDEIKRRLVASAAGGPQIPDTLSTTIGRPVVPRNAHHDTFASNKLSDADRRRMQFEQDADFGPLLEPALDAALFSDPHETKVALMRVLAAHFGVRQA